MTSFVVPSIPSAQQLSAHFAPHPRRLPKRSHNFDPLAFSTSTRSLAATSLYLQFSGASPGRTIRSLAYLDRGAFLSATPPKARRRFSAEARNSGFRGEKDIASSDSIRRVFSMLLGPIELIFRIPRILWAIFTKEKTVLSEIEEEVDRAAETVKESAKVIAEVAHDVEKIAEEIDKDAKKIDELMDKIPALPGDLNKAVKVVKETVKVIEVAAEGLEKMSKVAEEDAEKVDALAHKVEKTAKEVHEDIDKAFGGLGSSGGNASKCQINETQDEKIQEREAIGRSAGGLYKAGWASTGADLSSSYRSSRVVTGGWSVWNPWRSVVRGLEASNCAEDYRWVRRIVMRAAVVLGLCVMVLRAAPHELSAQLFMLSSKM